MNREPGWGPRRARYANNAVTGQMSSPVLPMTTLTPILPWSVFECSSFNDITDGLKLLSVERSLRDKCVLGSYVGLTVISPERQKEKNVTDEAAHNIVVLKEGSD